MLIWTSVSCYSCVAYFFWELLSFVADMPFSYLSALGLEILKLGYQDSVHDDIGLATTYNMTWKDETGLGWYVCVFNHFLFYRHNREQSNCSRSIKLPTLLFVIVLIHLIFPP